MRARAPLKTTTETSDMRQPTMHCKIKQKNIRNELELILEARMIHPPRRTNTVYEWPRKLLLVVGKGRRSNSGSGVVGRVTKQ